MAMHLDTAGWWSDCQLLRKALSFSRNAYSQLWVLRIYVKHLSSRPWNAHPHVKPTKMPAESSRSIKAATFSYVILNPPPVKSRMSYSHSWEISFSHQRLFADPPRQKCLAMHTFSQSLLGSTLLKSREEEQNWASASKVTDSVIVVPSEKVGHWYRLDMSPLDQFNSRRLRISYGAEADWQERSR